MAKRRQVSARVSTEGVKGLGDSLADVAALIEAWKRQREDIAAEVRAVFSRSQEFLRELGEGSEATVSVPAAVRPKRKTGRPKGYKASAATKAKLRAAWKRRKAAIAAGMASPS